jgi:hypothetical protein
MQAFYDNDMSMSLISLCSTICAVSLINVNCITVQLTSCLQTSQTGGQWYSDSSPFSIPWCVLSLYSGIFIDIVVTISMGILRFGIVTLVYGSIREYYVRDLCICLGFLRLSGLLRSGLLRSGKLRSAVRLN